MENCKLIYITTSGIEEAREIAGAMIREKRAACANILPQMESVYEWKDEIQHDSEVVLLLKTTEGQVEGITRRVNELHSYDLPCVVALDLNDGSAPFLNWIRSEVKAGSGK